MGPLRLIAFWYTSHGDKSPLIFKSPLKLLLIELLPFLLDLSVVLLLLCCCYALSSGLLSSPSLPALPPCTSNSSIAAASCSSDWPSCYSSTLASSCDACAPIGAKNEALRWIPELLLGTSANLCLAPALLGCECRTPNGLKCTVGVGKGCENRAVAYSGLLVEVSRRGGLSGGGNVSVFEVPSLVDSSLELPSYSTYSCTPVIRTASSSTSTSSAVPPPYC